MTTAWIPVEGRNVGPAFPAVGRLTRGADGHPDDEAPELPPAACGRRLEFRTNA